MSIDALKAELIKLMPVFNDADWGPQYYTCRWCGCYVGSEPDFIKEGGNWQLHKEDCFAVKYLGRPSR